MKSNTKINLKKVFLIGLLLFVIVLFGFLYTYFIQADVDKIGYVKVSIIKKPRSVYESEFEGRVVDSRGNDKLLFKFKLLDIETNREFTFEPRRFFAWGKNFVAYTQNLKELILVDYKTRKEVYKQKLNEGIEFINVNKEKEEFVISTKKALYILRINGEQGKKNKLSFVLKRIAEGNFWWPVLSDDSRYVVCGEVCSRRFIATSLVLINLQNNQKKKILSEKMGNLPLTVDHRLIYSTAISKENKWVVTSTSSSGTPPYRYLTAINLKNGLVKEFGSNTGLCNSPGFFISNDKYMFTQGEPEYRGFGDYSPIVEPFRSKPIIVDLNTGKLEIISNVPEDVNIYWPIYKNDKTIYFIDRKYYSFVPNKIFDTNIYRLKNKKFELLFQIKGGIVSYDVIPK